MSVQPGQWEYFFPLHLRNPRNCVDSISPSILQLQSIEWLQYLQLCLILSIQWISFHSLLLPHPFIPIIAWTGGLPSQNTRKTMVFDTVPEQCWFWEPMQKSWILSTLPSFLSLEALHLATTPHLPSSYPTLWQLVLPPLCTHCSSSCLFPSASSLSSIGSRILLTVSVLSETLPSPSRCRGTMLFTWALPVSLAEDWALGDAQSCWNDRDGPRDGGVQTNRGNRDNLSDREYVLGRPRGR